jgi:mediator of RNA polymerase II transcription subunit 17, fungi type
MGSKCDLIYSSLHAFLLRAHRFSGLRKGSSDSSRPATKLLQPIIDILQYEVFCKRVKAEVDIVCNSLKNIGIPSSVYFNPVGELGKQLIHALIDEETTILAGELVLRIDERYFDKHRSHPSFDNIL